MQLRNTLVMLTALSALSLVMTACDTGETSGATCTQDGDCTGTPAQICHPTAKICVQTCTAGADCPSTAKTCAAISASDSRQVCQCSTDALCNSGGSTDLVCSNLDKVCEAKCTTDAACGTGRTCDTATGQCKAGATCSPACGTGQTCDPTTNTCVNNNPGGTCSGDGQSTCKYGTEFCSTSTCTAIPAPSCQNYTNFSNKSSLGTTGTIIYSARVVSAASDTYCSNSNPSLPKRVKIALSAYSSTPFPATKAELNGFFYVVVDGTASDATQSVSTSTGNYTVSGAHQENAEIVYSLCRAADSTTTSTGFYFVNGNFFCFQANYL